MLLFVAVAQAGELPCAQVATMVEIHVPDDVILATLTGDLTRDNDQACMDGLPATIRERFRTIPLTPEPDLVPDAAPTPSPATTSEGTEPHAPARTDPRTAARLAYQLPDRGVAAAFGGIIGFGAGHFHAGRMGEGLAFGVIDASAWGLVGLVAAGEVKELKVGMVAGSVLFVSHLVQLGTAPPAAKTEALRRLEKAQ